MKDTIIKELKKSLVKLNYYHENINRWDKVTAYDVSDSQEKAPLYEVGLLFNGLDRFEKRDADYFRLVQPLYHHNNSYSNYIYFYSFANKVDDLQPSGTCNFSKIDSSKLTVEFYNYITEGNITIMAVNYNFLKIKKGMAGIIYS